MDKLWALVVGFTVVGIGAYGGGLVTVPLMERELVRNRALVERNQMAQIVAISQMTPGPIAVNAATFVGYRVAGIVGALLASAVVVLPALTILALVGCAQRRLSPNGHILRLRRGLRAGVLSLLLFAVWSYGRIVITSPFELFIALGAFLVLTRFEGDVHPLAVIGASGVVGLLVF